MLSKGSALELVDLTKQFGDAPATLKGINLKVEPGEFITFLGPSGSGKTTTLNLIAGFTDVTSGKILVDGVDVSSTPAHKRDMGVVFQQYALFPNMTAAENVAFPLQMRKMNKTEIAERVSHALSLVHLEKLGDRKPKQLSGGQQQRVAVARALVFDPRLLLMDEPLGALDKRLREQVQIELSRIHHDLGLSFIFVTHDQDEALSLSDRIVVFNEGSIAQVGTGDELYNNPHSLFVASFLGDSTIIAGILDGDVVRHDGQAVRAMRKPDMRDGDHVAVIVRPERMRIVADPALVTAGENVLDGVVTDVSYLGNARRVVLRLASGDTALVRETVDSGSRPGDSVQVAWRPEDSATVPATTDDLERIADVRIKARVS
jgi:putative spermidine/putrescine transport system ATP-binding protein